MEYVTGWATVLGLLVATGLYVMNVVDPPQGERRVSIHCAVGKLILVVMGAHILSVPFEGFNSFAIWSAVVLILLTIITGIVLNYAPNAGGIRYHARSIHPALIVAILIAVAHHVLTTL